MEYKFRKNFISSIDCNGRLTLISRDAIRNIETTSLIDSNKGIYRVEVRVYFHNSDRSTIFAKNFESLTELEENLKIQNKFILENW